MFVIIVPLFCFILPFLFLLSFFFFILSSSPFARCLFYVRIYILSCSLPLDFTFPLVFFIPLSHYCAFFAVNFSPSPFFFYIFSVKVFSYTFHLYLVLFLLSCIYSLLTFIFPFPHSCFLAVMMFCSYYFTLIYYFTLPIILVIYYFMFLDFAFLPLWRHLSVAVVHIILFFPLFMLFLLNSTITFLDQFHFSHNSYSFSFFLLLFFPSLFL